MTEMKDRITGTPNTGESPKYDATQTAVSYKPLKPVELTPDMFGSVPEKTYTKKEVENMRETLVSVCELKELAARKKVFEGDESFRGIADAWDEAGRGISSAFEMFLK